MVLALKYWKFHVKKRVFLIFILDSAAIFFDPGLSGGLKVEKKKNVLVWIPMESIHTRA